VRQHSACYENGQVDFNRIAERAEFKNGLERVLKGSEEYRIALMCAEKEPLDCHRTILVCHNLKSLGISIKHILYDGTIEDHHNAESRLLKLTNFEQKELFISDSERLELAYKKRACGLHIKQKIRRYLISIFEKIHFKTASL